MLENPSTRYTEIYLNSSDRVYTPSRIQVFDKLTFQKKLHYRNEQQRWLEFRTILINSLAKQMRLNIKWRSRWIFMRQNRWLVEQQMALISALIRSCPSGDACNKSSASYYGSPSMLRKLALYPLPIGSASAFRKFSETRDAFPAIRWDLRGRTRSASVFPSRKRSANNVDLGERAEGTRRRTYSRILGGSSNIIIPIYVNIIT